MRYLRLCSLFLLFAGTCGAQSTASSAPTSIPEKPAIFDLTAIDKTADPCDDFYQYACGNWNKANPIPSDQVRWGRFNELNERNVYLLYTELKAAADAPKSPLQKKYGNYFAACMNTDLADKLGAKPIQLELDVIAALTSNKELAAYNVKQQQLRADAALLTIIVDQDEKDSSKQIAEANQGGLTLPDRDYYLADDARSQKIREQYVAHVTTMFTLLGDAPDQAAKEAGDVMRIETALAKGSMSRVDQRDPEKIYHMMTVAELQQLTPVYNWRQYLTGIGMGQVKEINVSTPDFMKAVNAELETENLAAMKNYLRWHALHNAAALLSKPFVDENFSFFSQTLQGQKEQQPRWKRCTRMADVAVGEAVGQDWVKQNFPPDAKANMEKLVHALETAMAEDLKTLPWMSDATKIEARKKLDAMRDKIGYPEHWRNYSTLTIRRDDPVGNAYRVAVFNQRRNLAKYGKPVDETEWDMTPPTVNAYYNPPENDINFPAGILQPPFFDKNMDPAVNFGGIGAVIGHEMTHGFDDEGAKYDLHGNVKQWWTDEDLAKFKERTSCTANEYDGFEVAPGQNLNGNLTLGENTADNGGLRIAYQALLDTMAKGGPGDGFTDDKKDNYTPEQRFFISFGQVWCTNQTEQIARQLARTDPHSSAKWRVDGTVQNFDAFGKAFGCKAGQPMMPASGGCRTW